MKKLLTSFTLASAIVTGSFANELLLKKEGLSTYIQEEEFMVAEGENVIGPVFLLPIAKLQGLVVEGKDLKVKSYVIEGDNKNWRDALKGQVVSVEGEGRFLRGEVVNIKDDRIMLNTRKGFVVTTLPKFPSKLSSSLKWQELFSPKVTFKVTAKEAKTEKFILRYPVSGINWEINYILRKENGKAKLKGFIRLINNTPLSIGNVSLKLIENNKVIKELPETTLPAFSKKEILFLESDFPPKSKKQLPDGNVAIYEDGLFKGFKKLKNGKLE